MIPEAKPVHATGAIGHGFADPVQEAQAAFRTCLTAMSRPGLPQRLTGPNELPRGLYPTTAAVLLALADFETPVWLDGAARADAAIGEYVRFQRSSPIVDDKNSAAFALITDVASMSALEAFAQGSLQYPDRSTTLLIQVAAFRNQGLTFEGPGVNGTIQFQPEPMPHAFETQLTANRSAFPCGVDLIFATSSHIACLPRSSRLADREVACTSR
ncbi:MAG: phosphonate C-P lyase system protein PhnH [Pseudomonadota bacterium]